MKCYYEELGVTRDANDADIKSAYRKLALRWHPDKNLQCLEEAKERFQVIQQAYEVLSDSQERAWYDNHREQILRGKNSNYEEHCLDVFQYFTVSCFKGYGDDNGGFYAVYREVFEKIATEDVEFMDNEEELEQIPKFGDSQSSYEEVVAPFYAHWQAYCTKKTYTWLCPYDITEIKDRRILREIEKDLKKVVQKAKKERNEEIRNLVSFVRKRDKRVQAYRRQLEERTALNRQKQEQNRLEQIRRRQREVEEMRQNSSQTFSEGYEEQLKQLELQYGADSSDEDEEEGGSPLEEAENSEEDVEYVDDLYCVACNKSFKNYNAFANHESSKKHRDTVERMRLEMQEEEEAYREQEEDDEDDLADDDSDEPAESNANDGVDVSAHLMADGSNLNGHVAFNESDDETEEIQPSRKNRKTKKAKKNAKPNESTETDEIPASLQPTAEGGSDSEDWNNSNKKVNKKNKNKKQIKKIVKAKAVADNKATPTAAVDTAQDAEKPADAPDSATNHVCVTCKSTFKSKNKLFAHLKITNHGVYIAKAKAEPDGKPKKNKAKRN